MTAAREIVHAQRGRWRDNSGLCHCPSHHDRSPSLSVREANDGRVLLYCHAGCSQALVIESLRARGLWSKQSAKCQRQLTRIQAVRRRDSRISEEERIRRAVYLWQHRVPIDGSPGEVYLRNCRGYVGDFPATLGFLPPTKSGHYPALMAAFGIPQEPEPGTIEITDSAVRAIHLTLLLPDGTGKARVEPNKIMLGVVAGSPIVLAPLNDLFGLAVTQGIEDGLSILAATGLGVWVAGSASLMGRLGDVIPDYANCVSICADDDPAGRKGADDLASRLRERGIHVKSLWFKSLSHAA